MNKSIVWAVTAWLVAHGASAQDSPAPAQSAQVEPPAPAPPPVAPTGAAPVEPLPTVGARVEPAPSVEIIRTPLPPHRHLGGDPGRTISAGSSTDSARPRSLPGHYPSLFDGRMALALGGVLGYARDPGYDYFFAKNVQRGVDFAASFDVVRLLPKLAIAVGASVRSQRGESQDDVLALRAVNATLDFSARYDVIPILPIFVRAALGVAHARVAIDDDRFDLHGSDAGFVGQFGGGVVLQTAAGWFETYKGRLAKLSFGVTAEGGYTVGPSLSPRFANDPSFGITQRYAAPGKLDTHAPYLRILATLRF